MCSECVSILTQSRRSPRRGRSGGGAEAERSWRCERSEGVVSTAPVPVGLAAQWPASRCQRLPTTRTPSNFRKQPDKIIRRTRYRDKLIIT